MTKLTIINPVQVNKGKLLGNFDLITTDGLIIHGMRLLERDNRRWVDFPSVEFVNKNGRRCFTPLISYSTVEARAKLEGAVVPLAENALDMEGGQ